VAARLVFASATVLLIAVGSETAAASRARAAATQCVYFENPADLWRMASAVFVGTVASSRLTGQRGVHVTVEIGTFKVERSWKARLPAEIEVGNERSWEVGTKYLVFAGGTPLSTTTLCDWAMPLEKAKARLDWLSGTVSLKDIYDVMLRQSYHAWPASVRVVAQTGIPMPTLRGASKDWLAYFNGVPDEFLRFATEQVPTAPHPLDDSLLPAGTQLRRGDVKPSADDRSIFAFSPVLYTRQGLDAFVYYEARCWGICGEGGYAWLHRDTLQSAWRVAKRVQRWVS
jgi:hypothetical protein